MFTPHRVAGGPGKEVALNRIRVTKGTFISSGEKFEIIDDYTIGSSAHRLLPRGWVGTTEFRELDQQIRVAPTHKVSWADVTSDQEEPEAQVHQHRREHFPRQEDGLRRESSHREVVEHRVVARPRDVDGPPPEPSHRDEDGL